METIGDRIEIARKRLGISSRELSRRAGLGETQVATIVRRYRNNPAAEVSLPTMTQVAKALRVTLDWLVTGRNLREEYQTPSRAEAFSLTSTQKTLTRIAETASDPSPEQISTLLVMAHRLASRKNYSGSLLLLDEARRLMELAVKQSAEANEGTSERSETNEIK